VRSGIPVSSRRIEKRKNPVVDGEFQRAESNPAFLLFQDFNKKMWGSLYVRKNAMGSTM
jgi:zinc protease